MAEGLVKTPSNLAYRKAFRGIEIKSRKIRHVNNIPTDQQVEGHLEFLEDRGEVGRLKVLLFELFRVSLHLSCKLFNVVDAVIQQDD